MRVFLTGHGTTPRRLAEYQQAISSLTPRFQPASSPARADIILCAEPGDNKFRGYRDVLLADPLIAQFPQSVFVYEFSDRPVPFLPGLYVAVEPPGFDRRRMRSADRWTAIDAPSESALLGDAREPQLLFSFRGSGTAPVRRRLFGLDLSGVSARVTQTFRWRDYGSMDADEGKRTYLLEMRESQFVLCPRGLAASTYRLYEAMQIGRVPVILADDWMLPEGVPWSECCVRVAEERVAELPEILERFRPEAAAMGRTAREVWERYLRPGPVLMGRWLRAIEEIMDMRSPDWDESEHLGRSWSSQRFLWEHHIHPLQGIAGRAAAGLSQRRGRETADDPPEGAPAP
jgi:hypothetical protein